LDDPDRRLGHSADGGDDGPADPSEPARKETRDLVRLDIGLPVTKHFGAEEGPAAELVEERGELSVVRLARDRAKRFAFRRGALDIGGDSLEERPEPRESGLRAPAARVL